MADAAAKRREERVKLFATAFSNLGVASVVTGVIAPLTTARVHVAVAVAAFAVGVTLHLLGQGVLHFVTRMSAEEP